MRVKCFFASEFLLNRDRELGMVPMYFPRRGASTDMNHDLFGHHVTSRDLDLKQNFDLDLQGRYAYVSTRLNESNAMTFIFLPRFVF